MTTLSIGWDQPVDCEEWEDYDLCGLNDKLAVGALRLLRGGKGSCTRRSLALPYRQLPSTIGSIPLIRPSMVTAETH